MRCDNPECDLEFRPATPWQRFCQRPTAQLVELQVIAHQSTPLRSRRSSSRGSISIMTFAQQKWLRLSASRFVQILRVLHSLYQD